MIKTITIIIGYTYLTLVPNFNVRTANGVVPAHCVCVFASDVTVWDVIIYRQFIINDK